MPTYELVSHHLCPYVQRAAIVLTEKGVSFKRTLIDLDNKPDWFKAISPLGKVPLLKVTLDDGETVVLFESAVICEYLEETLPNPLHPADPLTRAQHRGWMEFGSAILADIWGYETAQGRGDGARQGRGAEAQVRAAGAGAGRRAILRRRDVLGRGCGVRAGVPLLRRVRCSGGAWHFRRYPGVAGLAGGACGAAQRPRRGRCGLS